MNEDGRYDDQDELNAAWASIYKTLRSGTLAYDIRNLDRTPQQRYDSCVELLEILATVWGSSAAEEVITTKAIMAELEVLITLGVDNE